MFDTVIVPLDGSEAAERALGPAIEVAERTDAEVVATMVIHDDRFDDHQTYLREVLARFPGPARPPYIIRGGDPAECIANAGEADRSIVVMTSHGSSGIRRAVVGSVAEGVVRRLSRPVLLVGPRCQPDRPIAGGRMMIPLDGSAQAEAILEPAGAWCASFHLEAWPVTVVSDDGSGRPTEAADEGYVRRVAADLADQRIRAAWEVFHHDEPAGPLITFALGLPASVVAIATHGRTGIGRMTVGSVAARMVHDALCPVLLLRPDLDEVNDQK